MNGPKNPQNAHEPPAQKAMKQTSKTASERGEEAEVGSDPLEEAPPKNVRKGDAPVGTTDNQGSSPYADRSRKDKPQREE
ncbi:hypothetical protein M2282_005218 [Variovorax boronicumulans]|uniref:hypothetical protein n=1 Tax=Variovorax boronicumulans TaxID=436515 RepID=UPI0024751E09|nr:hypothetical protein [Variovorax boronicumulans]MDH6170048.1 hypothetical protein [Variovorax boronicumulans]